MASRSIETDLNFQSAARVLNLPAPAAGGDAVRKSYADEFFASRHPGHRANRYYYGAGVGFLFDTIVMVANTIYFVPFPVPHAITVAELGFRVTAAVASSNAQLAVYANASGLPSGAPIWSSANIPTATTGAKTAAPAQALAPGFYWLAINCSHTPTLTSLHDLSNPWIVGGTADSDLANIPYTAQTFGTWPSSPVFSYTGGTYVFPFIWHRT